MQPKTDGQPRQFHYFERPDNSKPRVNIRLETIVHLAAFARLHNEFSWPLNQMVFESPSVRSTETSSVFDAGALDIILLDSPCESLPTPMTQDSARAHVAVEAKATPGDLDRMLRQMRACADEGKPHDQSIHRKCSSLDVFRPQLFLAVAAGACWRLFTVDERNQMRFLGEELHDLRALSH